MKKRFICLLSIAALFLSASGATTPVFAADENDAALIDFARNDLEVIYGFSYVLQRDLQKENMRYLLADVTGDGVNELIVTNASEFDAYRAIYVYANNDGNVSELFRGEQIVDEEFFLMRRDWLIMRDKNYYFAYKYGDQSETGYSYITDQHFGYGLLSESGEFLPVFDGFNRYESFINPNDRYDFSNRRYTYYLDGEQVTEEEYDQYWIKFMRGEEFYELTIDDFFTLDELAGSTEENAETADCIFYNHSIPRNTDAENMTDIYWFRIKNQSNTTAKGKYIFIPCGRYFDESTNKWLDNMPLGYDVVSYSIEPNSTKYGALINGNENSAPSHFIASSWDKRYDEPGVESGENWIDVPVENDVNVIVISVDDTEDIEEIKRELESNGIFSGISLSQVTAEYKTKAREWAKQYFE